MKKVLIIVVLLVLALVGYKILLPKNIAVDTAAGSTANTSANSEPSSISFDNFEDIPPTYVDTDSNSTSSVTLDSKPMAAVAPSFSCDGRQHCSQMRSCAEANYFIQHCPNTKMDGDRDGIPCEDQLCR